MIMIKKMNKLKCDTCHRLFPREELVFVKVARTPLLLPLKLVAALCHECDNRMVRYLRFTVGFGYEFDE